MSPSPQEAAAALRTIHSVQIRVAGFQDYRAESRQLMLWGTLNLLGCVFSALFPPFLLLIWLVVIIVGLLAGIRLACGLQQHAESDVVWRYLVIVGSVLVFAGLVHMVMWPLTPRQGSMLVPLFVAALYTIRGAQSRPRYLLIGATLAVLCSCCFLFAANYYWWFLALAWGGTFIASGFWLSRT